MDPRLDTHSAAVPAAVAVAVVRFEELDPQHKAGHCTVEARLEGDTLRYSWLPAPLKNGESDLDERCL